MRPLVKPSHQPVLLTASAKSMEEFLAFLEGASPSKLLEGPWLRGPLVFKTIHINVQLVA